MKSRGELVHCPPNESSRSCRNLSSKRRLTAACIFVSFSFVLRSNNVESFTPSSCRVRMRRRNQPFGRVGVSLFSDDNVSISTTQQSKLDPHEVPFDMQKESNLAEPIDLNSSLMKGFSLERMSSFGAIFSIGVVVLLALNNDPVETVGVSQGIGLNTNFVEGQVNAVITNVMNAALPKSATDVISVSLGEGIAGVIGAMATVAVTSVLQIPKTNAEMEKRSLVEEAVADGDYFFTRAAALPLLEAVGLPTFAATVASVVVAFVPYEIIKNRYKRQRELEQASVDVVLDGPMPEQTELATQQPPDALSLPTPVETDSGAGLRLPQQLDLVELFSDITKWLEYDVLKTDLNGKLSWSGHVLDPGIEGALFGFLAALSSKLYADVLYTYFGFGPESKRKELQERTMTASLSLYTSESLSSAALFGVYESVRFPVSDAISAVLSGGVDNCLGSDDFSLCMEVYMLNNPPEATWEGQLRSLVTALFSLWSRFESEAELESSDELVRALAVQFYSLANNLLGLELVY